MKKTFAILSIYVFVYSLNLFTLSYSNNNTNIWQKALNEIVYLTPNKFKNLPKEIKLYLEKNDFKTPQPYFYKEESKKYNVIKGQFYKKSIIDYAVLCSKNHKSKILVFKKGLANNIDEILEFNDINYLQGIGENKIGYSAGIESVGKKYVIDHYKWYGGPKPPPINHEGINFIFYDKASVIYYNYKGKWLKLTGAD